MLTSVDKNLLIASLESALLYAQNTVGVSSLEDLTTQIAALRSAFAADPENVTESMLESMIAKLQALEIPEPDKLSRLLTASTVTDNNTYLAVCSWATILNKPATFPPDEHGHAWSDITYKPISYPPSEHTHPGLTTDWNALTSKPATFPPSAHTHVTADVSDFPATLPPSAHQHVKADISDFPATVAADWTTLANKPTTFPPSEHQHTKANIIDFAHQHQKADISDFPATLPGRMEIVTWVGNGAATRVISLSGAFVPRYGIAIASSASSCWTYTCMPGRYWDATSLTAITTTMNLSSYQYSMMVWE